MKILKQGLIFFVIFLLVLIQVLYLYRQNKEKYSFYPNWTASYKKKALLVFSFLGVFIEVKPKSYQDDFNISRNKNSLTIFQRGIGINIKLCNNCFLIDYKDSLVFTKNDPSSDLVLKKKLVENGFKVKKTEKIQYKSSLQLAVFDAIAEDLVLLKPPIESLIRINDNDKDIEIISNQLKIEFL